jgi:hypothetical protein
VLVGESKSFAKEQVALVFHAPRRPARDQLARTLDAEIPDALKGALDWEVD